MFLEPVEVFARSDTSRVKPSKVTNTRVSNSRSSRSRVQRSRASNARVKKRTSSRARKENRVRRQNTRLSLEARWKRLPVKQKIKLYHSMVRTMAVLELSRRQRSTKTSSLYPFWQLFIAQAYAQAPFSEKCFFGGHVLSGCRWGAARRDSSKRCTLTGEYGAILNGIKCNSEIFPTAPCVQDFRDVGGTRRKTYSTTQACAYADAQLIADQLKNSGSLDLDAITPEQKNAVFWDQIIPGDLWASGNPEDWIEQRDQLIKDTLGGNDAMTRYNVALLNATDGNIVERLEDVEAACRLNHVQNPFEQKHCDVFINDFNVLKEAKEQRNCFKFHKLPGEHFCQVRTTTGVRDDATHKYRVVRLEKSGDDEQSRLKAVVYQSESGPAGDYCLDSSFTAHDKHVDNTQLTNFSNLTYPSQKEPGLACNRGQSHSASFTYQGHEIEIKKEHGPSNRCLFDDDIDDIDRDLGNDQTDLFFPGIANDENNNIYKTALEEYNNTKDQGENKDKCIEPYHVALHEAGLLFYKACPNPSSRDNLVARDPNKQSSEYDVFKPLSSWLAFLSYKDFETFSIFPSTNKETAKPINFIIPNCSDDSACRKNLTFMDYWCGIGNAPSADGTECTSPDSPAGEGEGSNTWTTGLANELRHCSEATQAPPARRRAGGATDGLRQ